MAYALFDIGGTKTRVAVSDDVRSFEEAEKFDTPALFSDGMELITDAIERRRKGRTIKAIAGGMRGPLNHEKTGIVSETVLTDWIGRSIVDAVQKKYKVPVFLENDAAIVALGEAHFGAGRGYNIVAYHTVSTGVGGARVVHGKIDVTATGFEPGHQVLDIDRSILGPNTPHTLQNLVSGEALEKRRGVKPYEISQSDKVWDELASYLARGLKTTILYWSPDVVVLGGSMIIGDPRIRLEDIVRYTKEQIGNSLPCPPIVDAQLSDEGGLYGALALLSQKKEG